MENKELYIQTLCLEVTRRCNMACPHCLRGDAQGLDMSVEVIDQVFENVAEIGSIVFTGGEPTLNLEAIRYTLAKCRKQGIPVSSFYLVTNGKEVSVEFLSLMLDWYVYCFMSTGEGDLSAVTLSKDDFHEPIPEANELLLRGLSFFREDKFQVSGNNWVISEGRAKELGLGVREKLPSKLDVNVEAAENKTRITFEDSEVYISANGDVVDGCDWSFENQTKHRLGCVFEQNNWIESALRRMEQ